MTPRPGRQAGLADRRVLVVGASSGIGRALAVQSGAAGARVALAARRLDEVQRAAAHIVEGGGDARAWRCDVTVPEDCARLVDEAAAWLGGVDLLLYMSGGSPLVKVGDAPAELWHTLLATNLVGASLVVAHALPHLRAAEAPAVVVTTHSMGTPWPWLGVYGSTKAALAELARALRVEEPAVRFVCVAVGNTMSSFADAWDPAVAGEAFEEWVANGRLRYEVMETDDMAGAILDAVLDRTGPDDLLIAGAEITSSSG